MGAKTCRDLRVKRVEQAAEEVVPANDGEGCPKVDQKKASRSRSQPLDKEVDRAVMCRREVDGDEMVVAACKLTSVGVSDSAQVWPRLRRESGARSTHLRHTCLLSRSRGSVVR